MLVDWADRYELETDLTIIAKLQGYALYFLQVFFTATCICYNGTKLAILFSFRGATLSTLYLTV